MNMCEAGGDDDEDERRLARSWHTLALACTH